jgi:CheY-like chemotaxis protein
MIMADTAKKILLVDDEPNIVKALKAYLEKAGFRVGTAGDGLSALAVFGRSNPKFWWFFRLQILVPGFQPGTCQMFLTVSTRRINPVRAKAAGRDWD